MKVVILANGDFPSAPQALAPLQQCDVLVCCDGALRHMESLEREGRQCFVVGDGDSVPTELRQRYADRYQLMPDQETNDLTKAVRFCLQQGWKELTIVGATGKREDHTLGNISLLAEYMEMGIQATMITDFGTLTPMSGQHMFASFPRQQVSIFSLTPEEPVSVEGLEYPIDQRPLRRWWEGTLNAALGNEFSVESTPEGRLIVFQTHEAKGEENEI